MRLSQVLSLYGSWYGASMPGEGLASSLLLDGLAGGEEVLPSPDSLNC